MFSGCVGEAVVKLFVDFFLDGGDLFFWVVWRRKTVPSGLSWKKGLLICWEMVDWS